MLFDASMFSGLSLSLLISTARVSALAVRAPSCTPFESSFAEGSVGEHSTFVPVDSPSSSYSIGPNGLELFLQRPSGTITRKGGVNNILASGATINGTSFNLYGKFSFVVKAPQTPGVVVAAILTAPGGDEIDIEILGGDPKHWETNIFAPQPSEKEPLYGVFGGLESFQGGSTVADFHTYTIDWNSERITWGVDGHNTRTIAKSETKINGTYHYPSHPMRVQLGIWDASSPIGTAEWGKGPIDWSKAPTKMSATFKSVKIECH